MDPNLYFSMKKEKMNMYSSFSKKAPEPEPEIIEDDNSGIFGTLKKISELDDSHPAKKYCRKRKIPEDRLQDLYYSPKFKKWTNRWSPGKFKEPIENEEPRLVIPCIDSQGVIGYVARSFDPNNKAKYIGITLIKTRPRLFWSDRVDLSKQHLIVEGPLDALFLPNCVAAGTSSIYVNANKYSILVPDNQPRNKDIVRIVRKCIDTGCETVIWPEDWTYKDINDAFLAGKDILDVIMKNKYKGLNAELAFTKWKKV